MKANGDKSHKKSAETGFKTVQNILITAERMTTYIQRDLKISKSEIYIDENTYNYAISAENKRNKRNYELWWTALTV